MSLLGKNFADLVGEVVRVREESLGVPFIGSVAEHEALISRAEVFIGLLEVTVDGVSDVGILSFNSGDDLGLIAVESDFLRGVADILADISCDLLEVDGRTLNGDLSKETKLKDIVKKNILPKG